MSYLFEDKLQLYYLYYLTINRRKVYFGKVGIEKNKDGFVKYYNGVKVWYNVICNVGYAHRIDGPAIDYNSNEEYKHFCWCLNGKEYSFSDWLERTPISLEEKVELRFLYS